MPRQHRAKARPVRHCVVCAELSIAIVCERCRIQHGWGTNHGIQYPIAVRGWWPDVGIGAVVARGFKENA